MEYIRCILCNIDDTYLLVKKDSFNVVRCRGCGLVYLNPRLNEIELAGLYNVSPSSSVESITDSQRFTDHDAHKIKKFKIAIKLLKKHENDIEKVFDLGCSTGIFLGLVVNEGWVPFGSDVNRTLMEENKKRYGNHVKLQSGKRIDFPDKYFDAVTLFDSIEHMSDPLAILNEVGRVVKDNGLIVISTPNVNGLFPRLTYILLGKTIGVWEHPTPPGHVFQFSKNTLKKTVGKAGFEWIDSRNFQNFILYTIGELENSIINVFRRKKCNEETPVQKAVLHETVKLNNNHVRAVPLSLLKKLPRLLIRVFSWGLVIPIYSIARLIRKGDSMVVIARKKH